MKKVLIFFCFILAMSCNTEDNKELIPLSTETDQIQGRKAPDNGVFSNNLAILEEMHSGQAESLTSGNLCFPDPDAPEQCETTFKVLCIDDCGRNLIEEGNVWVSFRYYTYDDSSPTFSTQVSRTWNNGEPSPFNLQIGQTYTLPEPVLQDCPIEIRGALFSCCFNCSDPTISCPSTADLELISGTIYLEINGAIYYPLNVFDLDLCETLGTDVPWPSNIQNVFLTSLDDNCYAEGRIDYVQDPCTDGNGDNGGSETF